MKTKKGDPFITARIAAGVDETLEDHIITFDAREVAYYHHHKDLDDEGIVTVSFKSGKEIEMYLKLDEECYPDDDNLITVIDMVQYSHFWHDNEDSTPDEDED